MSPARSRPSVKRLHSSTITTADLPSADVVRELLARLRERARRLDRPRRLELEGRLRPFERAINRWATVPPSTPSIQMALTLLLTLDAQDAG